MRKLDRLSRHILHRVSYALFYRIGGIISEIPTRRIIGMCVTKALDLFLTLTLHHLTLLPVWARRYAFPYIPHFTPTTLDVILSDMPTGRGIPWIGRPPGGEPPIEWRYDIRFYTNPTGALSILHCPRTYGFGAYHNPTYPIYRILSSFICRGTRRVILILPVLCILLCHRFYRIGVYPNPADSIYHTISYRRPTGGVSYGPDNRLAA